MRSEKFKKFIADVLNEINEMLDYFFEDSIVIDFIHFHEESNAKI